MNWKQVVSIVLSAYGVISFFATVAVLLGFVFNPVLFKVLNPFQTILAGYLWQTMGVQFISVSYVGWGLAAIAFGFGFWYWGRMEAKQ